MILNAGIWPNHTWRVGWIGVSMQPSYVAWSQPADLNLVETWWRRTSSGI